MLNDQWIKWQPLPNVAKLYTLENFVFGIGKFEIVLADAFDPSKKLQIDFEYSAFAYRHTKIEFKEKTLENLRKIHGQDFLDWTFFKVQNSSYAAWLAKQSCGINSTNDFKHFIFLTQDSILEVIDSSIGEDLCVLNLRST